jgi:hypothetical protein
MNLVQLNERLKDLPEQVIRQYANGMNPEIPAYVALGELQRRERVAKQMATAQGAAQGPQLSVKEQIEQKAGLMAAQALQQQQMMQQMAQPRGPMPAPAGVPQPEAQPQPPMMAARGGLARAPVRFDFQHGGIVAFSGGGGARVKKPLDAEAQKAIDEAQRSGDRSAMLGLLKNLAAAGYDLATLIPRAAMGVTEDLSNTRVGRALGVDFQLPQSAYGGNRASMTPMMDRISAEEPQQPSIPQMTSPQPTDQTYTRRMGASVPDSPLPPMTSPQPDEQTYVRKAGPTPPAPIADLKALAEQKQQQATRPAPAAAAPQAAPGGQESELSRLAIEAMRNPAKAMTPEEAMAQERKFAAQYGLDKPFGEEERGLLAAMKQRQAQYAAGRPMSELSAVLRGFGQGYGGAGAAGERASQETFNADMAHQREMLNAINALNKTNLETGRERYKTSGNLFGKDQESTAAANRERMQSLGLMSTAEANRKTQERGQDIQKEVAQINARANAAGRPFNIVEETFNRLKTGDPKKDAAILQNLAKEFAEYKKPGLDMELLKKFEALPGVKTDLETLSALRMIGSPKPETVTRIRQIESRLAAKARDNSIDPARIGITTAPVESPGVNSALFNKADAILSGGK